MVTLQSLFTALNQGGGRSVTMTVRGVPVRVASIDDLIALKQVAARPEDRSDIDALTRIKQIQGRDTA